MANFLMDHLMEIAIFMEYLRILRDIQWILAILWIPNVWWILLMDTDGIYSWMVCAIPFDFDFVGFWKDILKVGLLKVGFENPLVAVQWPLDD